jgi:ubiquitin C-terminal hydrolase
MNSILQCLFATTPLTKYFSAEFSQDKKMLKSYKLANAYKDLLKESRETPNGVVTPSELKSQVSRVAKQFSGFG